MNLPAMVHTARWMVRDTFRQSFATKLFWVMLAATGVATVFCASVRVAGDAAPRVNEGEIAAVLPPSEAAKFSAKDLKSSGVRVITGEVSLGFGAIKVPVARSREDSVRFLQLRLIGFVADTAGVLLALLWTAGFLPTFLEPQAASVLMAKPAPRWLILLGKYLGVVLFVGLHAALFVGGTWVATGLATGVWFGGYWLAVPLLTFNFAVFYAVSAFLAVWTRSTVASAFGTLLFWLIAWGMNYTRHYLVSLPPEALPGLSETGRLFVEAGYWLLPKPLDLGGVFFDALKADQFSAPVAELTAAREKGELHLGPSAAASATFAAATLALAGYELEMTDY